MHVISQKYANKKLHPLIVEKIKWYLLGNLEISLSILLSGLDCDKSEFLVIRYAVIIVNFCLTNHWAMCNLIVQI